MSGNGGMTTITVAQTSPNRGHESGCGPSRQPRRYAMNQAHN